MEKVDVMFEPIRAFLVQFGEFLPRILLVVAILVCGWLIAKAVKLTVVKGLRKVNFHVLTKRSGMDGFLQQGGTESNMGDIIGWLAYWLVILAALVVASNSVGLANVADLLVRAALLLARAILAIVILVFGCYFAYFVDSSIGAYAKALKLPDAALLGRLARLVIIAFMALIALDYLSIGGDLIRQSFLIMLAGVMLALGLAFGLGGREWAAALLKKWWPHREIPGDRSLKLRELEEHE